MYEVVSPEGGTAIEASPIISNLGTDLNGKKIGLVRVPFQNGDILLETLAGLMEKRFQGIEIVKVPSGRNLGWGDYPDNSLTEMVKEAGIRAAVVAVGC